MECDNGNDAPNLTNSLKKRRKKSLENRQDTALGTSATVDKNMSNLNGEVQVLKKVETTIGETSSGANVIDNTGVKKRKRKKTKECNQGAGGILSTRERTQEGLSKTTTADANMLSKEQDYTTEVANGKEEKREKKADLKNKRLTLAEILNPQCSESLEAAKGELGSCSGTTSTDGQASKKQKRRKSNKNADLGDVVSTRESTHEGLGTTKVLEVKSGETVSAKAATSDANVVSKEQDRTEVANGKEPNRKNKPATLAEILNPRNLQNLEVSEGEKGSGSTSIDNPVSKKQKRKLSKKSYSSDILSTAHESKQEVLSTAKVLEAVVSKGDHSEVANGKLDESETTNNGNDSPKLTKLEKKNRRALKKNLNANLGSSEKTEDNENPNSKPEAQFYSNTGIGTSATVDNKTSMSCPAGTGEMDSSMTTSLNVEVEVQRKVETSSGTTARDNTALKKRKREKKKSNQDLGDISSTRENTQEGSSTTIVFEVKNDETASVKTVRPDANMVSNEQDRTEVANGKKKRKRKPKSEDTLPTLGENLDPVYLPNIEAAAIPASKEQKGQTINNNPASGDICENTSKVVEAVSDGVSQGEKHMKDGIGTMSLTARTNLNVTGVRKEETKPKGPVKKLLVLDVNGLLADVVSDRPKDAIADKYINGRAIFKRPYLDDFLHFCFERFHVAIWSSITWKKLDPLVYYLVRDLRWKLLFMWDRCQCTDSCIDTLEVKHKSIVLKDLRKIWDEDGPNNKWVKGTFTESNTLLVDDSPYKGMLNPKYTSIFPASYSYKNSDDNFLGPKGELRTYLEGLAAADDVRTYVAQHPFGQGAIDEQSPQWEFYSSVLERLNDETLMKRLLKKNQWKIKKCRHGKQKPKRRSGKGQRW